MFRAAAFGLLVLIPSAARADAGLPARHVPVHITLGVDRDYPEHAFFLVELDRKTVVRVSPTTNEPAVVRSGNVDRSYLSISVYIVPVAEVEKFERGLPPIQWFEDKEHDRYAAGAISVRPVLDLFDNRDRIEQAYRVQQAGNAFRLQPPSENRSNPWVTAFWGTVCCVLPPVLLSVTIAWVGLRLMRRGKRKS